MVAQSGPRWPTVAHGGVGLGWPRSPSPQREGGRSQEVLMTAFTRSAQRCVVGPGATREIGEHAAQFGSRALVVGGRTAIEAVRPTLFPGLEAKGITYHLESGDHVRKTRSSVDQLAAI